VGRLWDAQKETCFCVLAARGFSPEEAARRADLADMENLLLGSVRVRRKIARLRAQLDEMFPPQALARAGLARIALGDASGVLDGQQTGGDLFHAAEVKLAKAGGVEIKFFDRLRALSMLAEMGGASGGDALLEALSLSARTLGTDEEATGSG
jgi:hypothetical protein